MVWVRHILKHLEGIGRLCSDSNENKHELEVPFNVRSLLEVSVGLYNLLSQERHSLVVFGNLFD